MTDTLNSYRYDPVTGTTPFPFRSLAMICTLVGIVLGSYVSDAVLSKFHSKYNVLKVSLHGDKKKESTLKQGKGDYL